MKKSHLLIDETPLIVLPTLAGLVGINEAIAIQQIHWVCRVKTEHEDYRTLHNGEMWCSYTVDQWLQKMPWLKERTCRRMLTGLEERKILIVTKPNAKEWNHTKWYRVDYTVLDKLDNSIYQKCQNDVDKLTGSMRTNWPDQDVDKLAASIDKRDLKKDFKRENPDAHEKKLFLKSELPPEPESVFTSIKESDDFYLYAFRELSKDSKKDRVAIEDDAKWMVLRLQRGKSDPRDRQYLNQFREGLESLTKADESEAMSKMVYDAIMRKYAQ